jgi:hypothetical protein
MESQKYQSSAQTDGGIAIGKFEIGSNINLAPFNDNLIGWWKFDEGAGTSTADNSGWGFDGIFSGNPTWLSSSACKSSNCLTFDGASRVTITTGSSYSFPQKQITMMLWLNNKVATAGRPLYKVSGGTNDFGFNFIYPSDGGIMVNIGTGLQADNGSLSLNTWTHLAATYDGTTIKIYKNGVVIKSASYSGSVSNAATNFGIGGLTSGSGYINGDIDDVRIYRRTLSAAEILSLYNATK